MDPREDKSVEAAMLNAGIPKHMWSGVKEVAILLEGDPDGLWSMLDDYGYNVPFSDVQLIVERANS